MNGNQHEVLCNHLSAEHNTKISRKFRREILLEGSTDPEDYEQKRKQSEMEVEDLQRKKRNEQKKEINCQKEPKLPDKSPMPIFLYMNVSKILNWDELNEVIRICITQ